MKNTLPMAGVILALLTFVSSVMGQITVTPITGVSAVNDVLLGGGVTVANVVYTGADVAIGKFTATPNTVSMPFSGGIVLSTGIASEVSGKASPIGGGYASEDNGRGSDPQLASLVTGEVKDASVLEFDFIPESDTVRFRYIFASEEYPQFENMSYNDIFGFFISGADPQGGNYLNKNIALLPNSNTEVSIHTVNHTNNTAYFVENINGPHLALNGRTVVLTAMAVVVPCTQYHIKLAIGDVGDGSWDSGVFLEANSFSSPKVVVTPNYSTSLMDGNAIEGCTDVKLTVKLPYPEMSDRWISYGYEGSAVKDVDYLSDYINPDPDFPEYLIIPAGQDSMVINIHPINDNISEPTESIHFIIGSSKCNSAEYDTVIVNIINRDSLLLSVTGDTLVCRGDTAHLRAQVTGGLEPYQYLWDNNSSQLEQAFIPTDSVHTYIFTVTDLCDYQSRDSLIMVKTSVDLFVRSDTTICEGDSVLLSAVGSNTITWTGLSGESPVVVPDQTTEYEASVSNICGVAKDTVTVTVDKIPYFSLGADTVVCDQNDIVIGIPLLGNSEYLWSNGYTTNEIRINSANTYMLNVTRGVCSYTDTIIVNPSFCNWWIPNAFSPDISGVNEVFKPVGFPIPQYEMIIFDRWGEVVFKTNEWNNGWDGTYEGQKAPIGLYFYQIYGETHSSKNKVFVTQGSIMLIR